MCLYHTYHWSCCPGTAQPAPYYMNSKCDVATSSLRANKPSGIVKSRKCKIQHKILDGGDHDQPCPKCGHVPLEVPEDESETAQQSSPDAIDPRSEQLVWMIAKIVEQEQIKAAIITKSSDSQMR